VVVIVGAGPIGLLLMLMVQTVGASRVVVTGLGIDQSRLKVANRLGAEIINIEVEKPEKKILEITQGLGADVVFETAGHPSAVLQSLRLVRKGGRVGLVGLPHASTQINTASLAFKEIDLIGIRAYTPLTWKKNQKILPKINLTQIITHSLPLREVAQGINLVKERKGIKVLLVPE